MRFDLLTKACDYINEFCLSEYDDYADFSNLEEVPLAYTTDDEGNDIQVYADLVNFRLITERHEKPNEVIQFEDLEEFLTIQLMYLDFSELVAD